MCKTLCLLYLMVTCFSVKTALNVSQTFPTVSYAIFDLDGTLIDTESCYKDAANQVTMSLVNKPFTWENKSQLMGTDLRGNSQKIVNAFNLPISAEQFYNQTIEAFSSLVQKVPFMPGAIEIITYFKNVKIPLALCTASEFDTYWMKVKQYGDFFKPGNYFDIVVVAGSDPNVTRNKPDPEPYLYTMSKFMPKPKAGENVIVFEDSRDGVTSGLRAGTQVVMIPDKRVDNGNATGAATLVIDTLVDFEPLLFGLPAWTKNSSTIVNNTLLSSVNFVRLG